MLANDASAAKPTAKEAKVNIYVEILNSEWFSRSFVALSIASLACSRAVFSNCP